MTPSQISFQAFKAMGKALCQHTAGHIPSPFIETLNPVRRGWAWSGFFCARRIVTS